MDIEGMAYDGRLGCDFPLPVDEPFTYAQALEAGVTRRQLSQLQKEGLVRRPIKGVYVGTHLPDSLDLRAACLSPAVPSDCVVVDRHAGWLLGAEMVLRPNEHLDLRPLSLFRPSGHGRLRNSIAASGERNLRDGDVTVVHGMQVTTPLRTAWDLGRVRWTDEAISGLDALFRLRAFTREEFLAGIERFAGMRWVRTLREIGPHADGRSESPGESVLRLRCIEAGLPVVPQVEVYDGDVLLGRLDLLNDDLPLGVEYDGIEWHSSPDQLEHDRDRRAAMLDAGYRVRAFGVEDVFGRARACEPILREAAREARIARRRRAS